MLRIAIPSYVYGPRSADGSYSERLAFDDDAGWGRLSRIRGLEVEAGEYMFVVGTYSGLGRGRFRIGYECEGCEATTTCPLEVTRAYADCVAEVLAEGGFRDTDQEAFDICTTDFSLDWFIASCERGDPLSWCTDREDYRERVIPVCVEELRPEVVEVELSSMDLSDDLAAAFEAECCWAESWIAESDAELTLDLVLDAVRAQLESPDEWEDLGEVSLSRFDTAAEHLGEGIAERIRVQGGSDSFQIGLLHREWAIAPGADAREDVFVFLFESDTVVAAGFADGD